MHRAVKETVEYIAVGIQSLGMKSTIEVEEESDTEFQIIMAGLGVSMLVETDGHVRRGIGGRESRSPKFQVFTIEDVADTRDEPGGTDEIHRGDYIYMAEAVASVFELCVRDHILNMIGSLAEAHAQEEDTRIAAENGYHGLAGVKGNA